MVEGCGGLVLLVRDGKPPTVIIDMEDFRYKLHRESARAAGRTPAEVSVPRLSEPKVKGFREPIWYRGFDGVLWPLWARCREHGAALVQRAEVESAYQEYLRVGRTQTIKVHPS